ncbi:bifunctional diaminohydroxyphosphoribosylaminopyrimidine deaminase/5-amino-6-(5-phosphoribosylamino)uracil reductase RibD [Aminicella lysinilytica]|uniref:Riboflavin biosynthesis protein RibD n=1 Tax=Aminicella lysinilytica TaxID=433323 RepID=A0A4V3CRN1_9FIRM|nr:bifunctional diaminohydroxyphosphoribosylaminopyrimidine deaminase/5-amino-6-(5-phosphoribosylamino)uracil reductase RibD [Aminicella lysinilytica]NLD11105.1 bifunctional diaminohydroxyphosphoribosylaminopyrimidine deaminase/5-amino-6-(5-phosphoribosylamino)uracil reductase RibD [Clostridiales bacterium]TDP57462.1 diaminohydroxyphosphoribosylaminopyrimidine deaminase/5-amino-6-(5-phosphoribosylamino)uracil reductase [Aminicella lysinilytica]
MNDKDYMTLAIDLARRGGGYVNPNPQVGAVIVRDGVIIGQGYHEKCGELHAERNALASCTTDPRGATMYVTLEPCCHYGKTPPCTAAIIEKGIARVVIGSRDPNPKVSGKGAEQLRAAGIEVVRDFMQGECDELNAIFFHYITKGRPLVTMKYAMTMDGKIATHTGASKWISCEASRIHTHEARARNMAIMVGLGTVVNDDPSLTARAGIGPDPLRIVCDSNLYTPLSAKIVGPGTIIATCESDVDKCRKFTEKGAEVLTLGRNKNGQVDLCELIAALGERKIDSLIIEGGSTLNWSALEAGIVDKLQVYVATKVFGGAEAKSPVGGPGVELPDYAFKLQNTRITNIESDILIESQVIPCSQG